MNKKKILIVDDEENFTRLIKLNLEQAGVYEVKVENKGPLGFIAAKEFKPDLILLDIMMPGADGGDVCNQLKNDKDTKDIPILFLTAIVTKEEIKDNNSIIAGRPFVAKPVDMGELIEAIEKNIC